jgi:hypothetical protein
MSWRKAESSRFDRSIVTNITSGTASQTTTPVGSQTYQIRVTSTLPIWAVVGSTTATANSGALVPANRAEYFITTPGQVFSFISTSTSSGYVVVSEMT